MFVMCWMYL